MAGQIALNKPSGGQLILAPEDGASTETISIPSAGIKAANDVTGQILQVQQGVKLDTSAHSGTSYVTLPGLSVNITPASTSNKIRIDWTIWFGQTAQYHRTVGTLRRTVNGVVTYPFQANADGSRSRNTWGTQDGAGIHGSTYCATGSFIDEPNTTDVVTYDFIWSGEGGTAYINRGYEADGDNSITQRLASSIIATEVAA